MSALFFVSSISSGCSKDNFGVTFNAISLLMKRGIDTNLEDARGNSALLSVGKLLDRGLFEEGFRLAGLLLQDPGCDPNRVNASGQTLLSQSVGHGDSSILLSRLLVNHGAKVVPSRADDPAPPHLGGRSFAEALEAERGRSAFTWFLRSLVRTRSLSNTEETVHLLCQSMSEESVAIKDHVVGTMICMSESARTEGHIFLELKLKVAPYWREPRTLRQLCRRSIRKSLGPQIASQRVSSQLKLPETLLSYLQS